MSKDKLELLIAAWLDGRISEKESAQLQEQLLHSKSARQLFARYVKLDAGLRQVADDELHQLALSESSGNLNVRPAGGASRVVLEEEVSEFKSSTNRRLRVGLASLAVAVAVSGLLLIANSDWFSANRAAPSVAVNEDSVPMIATVKGVSGPIRWTGNGGRVKHGVMEGEVLPGGTIDGLAPESWFEFEFNDGSVVSLSGTSMLTFSDDGQKILHLKSGQLAANVSEQPKDAPMLLHTRSATVTVLGTRFEVDAGLPATSVMVNQGSVRVARSSDGKAIEVAENHRIVATADSELVAERVSNAVHTWSSQIGAGPQEVFGEWIAATDDRPAQVKSVAYIPEVAPSVVIYLVGMGVSRKAQSPVQLLEGSRFEVRGLTDFETPLFIGCQVNTAEGEFAGKFMTQAEMHREESGEFVAEVSLAKFELDPSVGDAKESLPKSPTGLVLQSVWCFTHSDEPSGLAVYEIEVEAAK